MVLACLLDLLFGLRLVSRCLDRKRKMRSATPQLMEILNESRVFRSPSVPREKTQHFYMVEASSSRSNNTLAI